MWRQAVACQSHNGRRPPGPSQAWHRAAGGIKGVIRTFKVSPRRSSSRRASSRSPCCPGCGRTSRSHGRSGERPRCCWPGTRCWPFDSPASLRAGRPPARFDDLRLVPPRAQHYVQSCCQFAVYAVLGVVLGAGLRLPAAARRPAAVCLRVRHAPGVVAGRGIPPGLRPLPDRLQHQPVSLVQGRLVLLAVRPDRARLCRQGVRALAARRPARAHLQSVGVHARRLLAGPARHRHDASDLGPGDRHDLQPRPAHLRRAVRHRPRRDVLLLRSRR